MKKSESSRKKEVNVDSLISRFLKDALDYAAKRKERDFVAGNVFARRLGKTARILRNEAGDSGRVALAKLMDHDHPTVRAMVAADCLDYATAKAEKVLAAIAPMSGLDGLSAETALAEWRAGRKIFP